MDVADAQLAARAAWGLLRQDRQDAQARGIGQGLIEAGEGRRVAHARGGVVAQQVATYLR